jgi:predicted  nucleic acid-binding Zn-ribbon protein
MSYKSSFDAETANIKQENELQQAVKDYGVVESAINALRRESLDLDIKIADLREPHRKARETIKRLESELRVSKAEFFRLKNANL